jgi:tRNA dimethylallyltransferase
MEKITQATQENILKDKLLVIIGGPTASGKTGASIELSKLLDIEVISADSRQIFKHMDIGTAKASKEEQDAVPHHFIDIVEPDELYSAGRFGDEATIVANDIIKRGKVPCVVGGSGLYIKALAEGLFNEEKNPKLLKIREKLNTEYKKQGIDVMFSRLRTIDPKSAEMYADRNPRRVIRALEYFELNEMPFSEAHKDLATIRDFKPKYFAINYDRKKLYERIDRRAEMMWQGGLIEETKKVLEMGYSKECNSLNSPGYKEVIEFLDGELTEDKALEKMQMMTRRFSKRQFTWFKKVDRVKWLMGNDKEIAEKIAGKLNDIYEEND